MTRLLRNEKGRIVAGEGISHTRTFYSNEEKRRRGEEENEEKDERGEGCEDALKCVVFTAR